MKEIHLLYTQLEDGASLSAHHELLVNLPALVKEKISQYSNEKDRLLRLAGYQLLYKGLEVFGFEAKDLLHINYNRLQGQKPHLANTNISFSLSYSKDVAVCAISEGIKLGVDVEQESPLNIELLSDYFDQESWQAITSSTHPLTAFYREWTRRESIIKALGFELSEEALRQIQIRGDHGFYKSRKFKLHPYQLVSQYWIHLSYESPLTPQEIKIRPVRFDMRDVLK